MPPFGSLVEVNCAALEGMGVGIHTRTVLFQAIPRDLTVSVL